MIITEKELKVLINSEGGKSLIKQLADSSNLNEYTFGPVERQHIEDIYIDFSDLTLKTNNAYLRIRGREGLHTLTLRKEITDNYEVDVNEVTHPLNDEGVLLIIQELLRDKWIKGNPALFKPSFIEVFQSIGLFEKVRITIHRLIRDLFIEDIKIGKIKFDEFHYHPKENDHYYVIELNTYKKAYHLPLNNFFEILSAKYGYRLELTNVNKYNRGLELRG